MPTPTPDARLILGDCLDVLRTLPDASVDSVVTDPPAGIAFMGKGWDTFPTRKRPAGHTFSDGRARPGISEGQEFRKANRGPFIAFLAPRLAECLRVARPGARMLCWSIPRTSHWTGTAIEDAGWIIEDTVLHLFGTGFPKAKSKLKPGHESWWLARKPGGPVPPLPGLDACRISANGLHEVTQGMGKHGADGWGMGRNTYEVPSGRWPPNVTLSHVDGPGGCVEVGTRRVKGDGHWTHKRDIGDGNIYGKGGRTEDDFGNLMAGPDGTEVVPAWRCHPECPVAALDAMSGDRPGATSNGRKGVKGLYGLGIGASEQVAGYADSGGASRFFATFGYHPKASRSDRGEGNLHPTVKSTSLMDWLIRLITPEGGTVLDPFAGSGSTGKAAVLGGFGFVGMESDPASHATAESRLAAARRRPAEVPA